MEKAKRRLFTAAALLIISLTAILLFYYLFAYLFFRPHPPPAKRMTILVYPFEYKGEKEHAWIAAGMTDSVIAELGCIQDISAVGNRERRRIREEMTSALSGLKEEDRMTALARYAGADVIFTGSYIVSGTRIVVYPRLVYIGTGVTMHAAKVETGAETGAARHAIQIEGTSDDIFALQDQVVSALMGMAEEIAGAGIQPVQFTGQDKKRIAERPRPGAAAYKWYAKGLEMEDTNPKEALANFRKAIEIDPGYTDALMNAGFTAGHTLNLFSEGLGYLEKAASVFKGRNETGSADYARLMMNIGYAWSLSQPDRALEYFLNSQSIRDKLGLQNTADYAGLMLSIGNVYLNKGKPDLALSYFLKSQSIEDKLGLTNTGIYAGLMMNTGIVYGNKGQYDRALEYYKNAQAIWDRLGLTDTAGFAGLMMGMGNVYWNKGLPDRALEYFMNSQSIQDRRGMQNTGDYARLMTGIGLVYRSKGQPEYALEYYRRSQSVYEKLKLTNTGDYANLIVSVGNVYQIKDQPGRALEYYRKSQSIFERLGLTNTAGFAGLLYNMAMIYEKQGRRDCAGRHYRKAYDAFLSAGSSGAEKDMALDAAKRLGY